ncbi:MAG TPA: hypothetical protein VLH85_06845 [Levilinea sp.]|nr:hypothetical protein [Levilinea sp.]
MFLQVHLIGPGESRLWQDLLRWARRHFAAEDVAVMDAGVKLAEVQAAGLECYLNFTARRNQPAPHCGKDRKPVYGQKVRPLTRSYKGKTIAATPPDRVETWTEEGDTLRAEIWEDLILPGVIPGPQAQTFRVYAIYDPAYSTPGFWRPRCACKPLRCEPCTRIAGRSSKCRFPPSKWSAPSAVRPRRRKHPAPGGISPVGRFDP